MGFEVVDFFDDVCAGGFGAGDGFWFCFRSVFDECPGVATFFTGDGFVDFTEGLEVALGAGDCAAFSDSCVVDCAVACVLGTVEVEFHWVCVFAFGKFFAAVEFFALAAFADEEHSFFAFWAFFVCFLGGFFGRKFVSFFVQVDDVVAFWVG